MSSAVGKTEYVLVAGCLLAGAAFLSWPEEASHEKAKTPSRAALSKPHEIGMIHVGEGRETPRKLARQELPLPVIVRPVKELKDEVERIFGQCEAARSRKLGEQFADGNGSYLYGVEPPSSGEVTTLKAGSRTFEKKFRRMESRDFEEWLAEAIKQYDPYGEVGKRALLISVPGNSNGRMSGFSFSTDNFDAEMANFQKGDFTMKNARGWSGSYDGKTLDRFQGLDRLGAGMSRACGGNFMEIMTNP